MEFPLDAFLDDLEILINTDSGTADIEGCSRMAAFFETRFRKAGFDTKLHRTGNAQRPVLLAKNPVAACVLPGVPAESGAILPNATATEVQAAASTLQPIQLAGKPFFFCGHLDTVFPKGTTTARPYRRDGDLVYGPGTVDMKAGALLILYLAEYLAEAAPQIPLTIALNSDEEIGSPDSAALLRSAAQDAQAIFIFEGQRKQGQFVNERKGIAKFAIDVSGIASHAGTAPAEGVSAILELAKTIVDLSNLQHLERGTSVNVGLLEGGTALNMIAPHAAAKMEVRYTEAKEFRRVLRALDNLQTHPHLDGAKIRVTRISHYPPLVITSQTRAMMERLAPLGLHYVRAGGTSDANRLADLGIPILDGCGPGGGFPHSEKEFLDITTVPQRFERMLQILKALAG